MSHTSLLREGQRAGSLKAIPLCPHLHLKILPYKQNAVITLSFCFFGCLLVCFNLNQFETPWHSGYSLSLSQTVAGCMLLLGAYFFQDCGSHSCTVGGSKRRERVLA